MEVILLRHAKAEAANPKGDAARELSEKGKLQAQNAGKLLRRVDRLPNLVLSSPRTRCRQTAEIFCEAAQIPGSVSERWLDCGAHPETILRELETLSDFERVMIVGHEPDFSQFVQFIIGNANSAIQVKKGSLVGISINPSSPKGKLLYYIPPKLMK